MIRWVLFQGNKDVPASTNQTMSTAMLKKKKKKKDENHRIISTDAEKNNCQELASFYNKRKILIKGVLKEIP